MAERLVYGPASPKQEMALNTSSDITLMGGSAGCGKSFLLCLLALKYLQDPNSTVILFRRTTKQLNTPGGIWSEAVKMYKSIYGNKIKIKNRDNEIIFPNGAVFKFSHLEHERNVYDHQGGQYSLILFDEGTHFSKTMVMYLLSRMRNAKVKYTPRMVISCNPDADHWLKEMVDHCLDENGIPIDEKALNERYFVVQNGDFIWADDRKELEAIYGSGPDSGIRSFSFVPFTCQDNPVLMKAQPDYVSNLKALGPVQEKRLLWGSWTAREEGAQYWNREWVEVVNHVQGRVTDRVRSWDIAATRPHEGNRDPDWTAGVLMCKTQERLYYVEDVKRFRDNFAGVEEKILKQAMEDGPDVLITFPLDPGAQAHSYARGFQARMAEKGFRVKLVKPILSKLTRFGSFASLSESGKVKVIRGEWNEDFFKELEAFTGDRKGRDDQVDACSDAFNHLRTSLELPNFAISNMTKTNVFANHFNN